MGKGEIISEYGNGYYAVKIIYGYRDKVNQRIGNMQNQITLLNQKIAAMDNGLEKDIMELQVKSLEKCTKWNPILSVSLLSRSLFPDPKQPS